MSWNWTKEHVATQVEKRVKPVRIQEIQLLVAFFHQKIWIYEENIVLLHSQTSNNGEVAQMVRAQDS